MSLNKEISSQPYPLNLYYALRPVSEKESPPNLLGAVESQLDTLAERERQALHLRYRDGLTLAKIGESLGVSGEYAGKIIAKAIRKMRHPSRMRHIEMYEGR